MSLSESVSLSENFTYDTGLAVVTLTPGLGAGLVGVGIFSLLWEIGFG